MITQCPKTGRTCEVTGCDGCWKAEQAEQEYPTGEVIGACICGSWPGGKCLKCPRIETEAQYPVALAWSNLEGTKFVGNGDKWKHQDCVVPLYAAPVRTKDLTDDEIVEIMKQPFNQREYMEQFARAVIAADREKNNANNNS